jgi:CRISPR type III-A-associated RAMP protein Csm5
MNIRLKLKTLSPVHIGSGEKITSYNDYIYDDGYVYYIDYDALEEYIMKQNNIDEIIDDFVNTVKIQASNNKKEKYKLKNFFEDNGLNYKDFSYNKLSANEEITEQINRAVCSGIRPYIPGSSIKGAIRTAFIYRFFSKDKIDLFKILKEKKNPYIGQEILGKYSQDIFKHFKVSDTTLLDKDDLEIIKTHREHFKKKANIPANVEAIKAGKECELDVSMKFKEENLLTDTKLKAFYDANSINDERFLFDILNAYAKEFLEGEVRELTQVNNEKKYNDLINQNIKLLNEVEDLLKKGDGAVLRLGFGKTFFSNSISMQFHKNDIKEIRKAVFSSKDKNMHKYEPFPITRTIYYKNTGDKGEFGWVRIKKY